MDIDVDILYYNTCLKYYTYYYLLLIFYYYEMQKRISMKKIEYLKRCSWHSFKCSKWKILRTGTLIKLMCGLLY